MNKLSLEELRACEVGCLKAVHSFCEEHGLKYYLAFGTLIGAVRHKGFIPWDDDIDILMPRRDYNYLVQNFRAENYRLISIENEPEFYLTYAKVIDTRTKMREKGRKLPIGAFVDIFPLENLPNGRIRRYLFGNLVRHRRIAYALARKKLTEKTPNRAKVRFYQLLYRGRDTFALNLRWKYTQKYLDQENTQYYSLMHRHYPAVPVLDAQWFAEQVPMEFEGEMFYAPSGYDAFLRYCYGDYLQLPQAEKQKSHHRFTCRWKENAQGKQSVKKVLTFGVFDYFHLGHLALFERAKEYGGHLTVAVQEDDCVRKYKPDAELFYSTAQRLHLVGALTVVDAVCTYRDVDSDIQTMDFDILVPGEEQNHAGFRRAEQWCRDNGKEVVRLSRTRGMSSTQIKEAIRNDSGSNHETA